MRAIRPGAGSFPRRRFRRRCTRNCSSTSRSACRTTSRCSAIRWRDPNNDLRAGHRRYNFVWYRPASEERELPRLLTDEQGRTHSLSIPPPLIAREVVAEMREAAARVLAPQFNAMVALCEQPFLQPIYDLEVPRMAFGRVALVGDAAFVARPHIGAGVAKAADDALALADALAANPNVEAALRQFETPRLAAGQRILARTRHLGAYVQADLKTEPSANTPRATARPRRCWPRPR